MDTVVLQCTAFMYDRQHKWIDIQHQVSKVWRFQACHGGNHPEQQNSLLPLSCVWLDNRIPVDRDGRALASLLAVQDDKRRQRLCWMHWDSGRGRNGDKLTYFIEELIDVFCCFRGSFHEEQPIFLRILQAFLRCIQSFSKQIY